jgi:hypothetical protein
MRGKTRSQREHEQEDNKEDQARSSSMAENEQLPPHDPKAASHPPNCECLRLRPGLFLPPSLQQEEDLEDDDDKDKA